MVVLRVSALLVAITAAGCTKPNPRSCADGTCTDPAFPFCDVDGAFGGEPNECIAVTCTPMEVAGCRGDVAIACNSAGNSYDAIQCEHRCDQPSGGCIECLDDEHCEGTTPICDAASHQCRRCESDAECVSGVCDMASGACVDESQVAYAAADGLGLAPCGRADPCPLMRAVDAAVATTPARALRLLPGTYETALLVDRTASMLIVGHEATLRGPTSGHAIMVSGGADVTIRGLEVALPTASIACGTPSTAKSELKLVDTRVQFDLGQILVDRCMLVLSESEVVGGENSGFVRISSDGEFEADRVRFVDPRLTAIQDRDIYASGQRVRVRITNSLMEGVRVVASTSDPVGGPDQSHFYSAFNTMILRTTHECLNPNNYRVTHVVENNIIASTREATAGFGTACTFANNIIFPQDPDLGGTNREVDPRFVNAANRDYRVQDGSPAIDTAVPSAMFTPTHDFSGAARPQGAGHDVGAYERAP